VKREAMFFKIVQLKAGYGKSEVLKGVSLEMNDGEILTIIGSNGAGKTTLLRTISGLIKPTSGEIWLENARIDKYPPEKIVRLGIAHVLEQRRLFPFLTVRENLNMGAYSRNDKGEIKNDIKKMYSLFPILEERESQLAGTLSGGEQQMLAVARALMSKPRIMILDEPSLGLAPFVVKELSTIIKKINENKVSIILVEQNAKMALSIADRGYVIDLGNMVLEGSSQDLRNNDMVAKTYLGF
jgi:branched-chain amino acid transport system ATP-binding protein